MYTCGVAQVIRMFNPYTASDPLPPLPPPSFQNEPILPPSLTGKQHAAEREVVVKGQAAEKKGPPALLQVVQGADNGEAWARHQQARIWVEGDDLDRGEGGHDGEGGARHQHARIQVEGDDLDRVL